MPITAAKDGNEAVKGNHNNYYIVELFLLHVSAFVETHYQKTKKKCVNKLNTIH